MAVVSSYATLQTAVDDYLARADLSTGGWVVNFIQNAENKIYRTLKIRDMETAFTGTVASGVVALPARYLDLKHAYVDESPTKWLTRVDPEEIYRTFPNRSGSAVPSLIGREAENFIFGDNGETRAIAGIYYQYYEPLRTTDPNWYVTNAPEVLLYGSLLEAEPFMAGDARLQGLLPVWRELFNDAVRTLTAQEKSERHSGGSVRAVAL